MAGGLLQKLIMRLEIELLIKGLRCLKGLFNTLLKILFSSKEKAGIFLVYFTQSKQMRFLVNSDNCLAILAIDPRLSVNDKSSSKEGSDLLAIEFKDGDVFLQSLCELVEKDSMGNVTFLLSKDKAVGNEEPFRSLTLISSSVKYRNQIFKPQYDPEPVINHEWLNGCSSVEQRKVEFDIQTEHLLNILRVLVRNKQSQSKQKIVRVLLHFSSSRFFVTMDRLKHNSEGAITYHSFNAQRYEGQYTFLIHSAHAAKVYELFLGKSSGNKIYIDIHNQLVFSYYQQGVFQSQLLIKEWISFESVELKHQRPSETKMEV